MTTRSSFRLAAFRPAALLVLAIGSTGALAQCPPTQTPPTLTCSDFSAYVPTGTCVRIANPCATAWVNPPHFDAFRIAEGDRPPSVFVRDERIDFVTTRSICATADSPNIANVSSVFIYQKGDEWGTAHVTMTVSPPLLVTAEARPMTIEPVHTWELFARVSGGIPPYSYSWTPTGGLTESHIPGPLASPPVTTLYEVSVTDAAGQTKYAQILVRVGQSLAVSASPTLINLGQQSQLNATPSGGRLPYTFAWTPADSLDDPTRSNPVATPAQTTTYTVTATDADGGTRVGTATVNVVTFRIEISALPPKVLAGESSQLDAFVAGGTPPYLVTWSPAGSLDDATSLTPVATPDQTTSYQLSATDAGGRTTFGGVTVQVVDLDVKASATPERVNPGESSQLGVTVRGGVPPYSFSWDNRAGTLDDPASDQPRATPLDSTFYDVTVTDATGASTDARVALYVVNVGVSLTASPANVNPNDTVQLSATVHGGVPPYTYFWNGPRIIDGLASSMAIAVPDATSRYEVSVYDHEFRVGFATVVVPVDLLVNPTATPAAINGRETSLLVAGAAGGSPPYSCSWSPAAGLSSATSCRPTAQPATTTTYAVTVTDAAGTSVVGQTAVTVNAASSPLAAAFTFSRNTSVTPALLVFDGSSSTGNIVSYTWDLVANGTQVHQVTSGPIVEIEVRQEGMNRGTMTLTVAAADGQTASLSIPYR
jgi:hypothetical protein